MKMKSEFLVLLLLMVLLLTGCGNDNVTKEDNLKLHDLYSEKNQSNSNRIYIKENDVMYSPFHKFYH